MTATDTTAAPPLPAPPPDQVVEVAGVPTTLRRRGGGRPVLFLHGAFFPTLWLPVHEALAAEVDLIAPVHPGYAEGAPPPWVRDLGDVVLHTHDLLLELGTGPVDVVGYDLGGWIGARLARSHPEVVRSLSVIAPSGLRVPGAPVLEFLGLPSGRLADALFNGDPGPWAPLLPSPADMDGFVEAYGQQGVTARLIWERRYETRLDRWLPQLRVPATVVGAAEDRVVPVEHARRWAELLGAPLTILDGVGHALVVQDPAAAAAPVLSLLKELP